VKQILTLTFLFLLLTCSAFAQDTTQNTEKDLCLLDINKCVGQSYYNIVEKINRINVALEAGSNVYSPQEIEHLKYMLDEALFCCDRIECHPSQVPEMADRDI